MRAAETAHCVRTPAALPKDPNLVSSARFQQLTTPYNLALSIQHSLLASLDTPNAHTHTPPHTHKYK